MGGNVKFGSSDMEAMLTRAVCRILDESGPSSNQIEKPRKILDSTTQGQARLIAEQLFRRLERRYEAKLNELLEKERNDADRRLAQLRQDFYLEESQRRKQLERERRIMEESMKEKERTMIHSFELRTMDRENRLDTQRKLLENRSEELKMASERLERASSDFKRRIASELETIRIEWQRISLKEENLKKSLSFTEEFNSLRNAVRKLTNEAEIHKNAAAKLEVELKNERRKNNEIKADLERAYAISNVLDSESTRASSLAKENTKLREEVRLLQVKLSEANSEDSKRNLLALNNEARANELKVQELFHALSLMKEKLQFAAKENDFLKRELKVSRSVSMLPQKVKIKPEPLSDSSSDSDDFEISNIKEKLSRLSEISQRLNTSVDLHSKVNKFSGVRGVRDWSSRIVETSHAVDLADKFEMKEVSTNESIKDVNRETKTTYREEMTMTGESPKKVEVQAPSFSLADRLASRNLDMQRVRGEPEEVGPSIKAVDTESYPVAIEAPAIEKPSTNTSEEANTYWKIMQESTAPTAHISSPDLAPERDSPPVMEELGEGNAVTFDEIEW